MYIFFLKKCFKKSLTQAYPPKSKASSGVNWNLTQRMSPTQWHLWLCDFVCNKPQVTSAVGHGLGQKMLWLWLVKNVGVHFFVYLCPLGKVLLAKKQYNSLHRCSKKISPFYLVSSTIIEIKVCHRQIFDRVYQWIYFLCVNLLPPYLLRLQGDIQN